MDAKIRFFNQENLFAFAFLIILISLIVLVITVLSPFLGDFFWAIILALTFYPLFRWLNQKMRGRASLASFILTGALLIALVLPGFFVLMNLGQEARKAYHDLATISWVEKGRYFTDVLHGAGFKGVVEKFGVEPEQAETIIREGISSGLREVPKMIGEQVSTVFKNLALFILHALFVAVALFFFFRDGEKYSRLLVEHLPLEEIHRDKVVNTFSRTVTAVVRGMFITAIAQGLLAGIGFAVAGVPVPVLLGVLTCITSMIPFLGATSVWLPASVWLFLQGQTLPAVGLALWGGLVVSVVDNVIKPMVIGEGTKISVFLLFFTILGGLRVYGVLGIFLGPIILAMGMAFLAIYKEIYLKQPVVEKKETGKAKEEPHPASTGA